MNKSKGRLFLGACLIVAMTLAAYVPALRAGYIWDDDDYLTRNPTLQTVDGLRRIWLEPGATMQYYPLVFTTFWIEYRLWHLEPFGYHLVNVLLHACGALLLWLVLRRLQLPGAWLAAAVFAIHPVNVESVAWITERKNTLSGVFYFSSLAAYLRFAHVNDRILLRPRLWGFYFLALLLFACALLSKTVTCTLPFAILLLLWWKREYITWPDVLPLVPIFLLGASLGLHTAWLEKNHVGAFGHEWALSFVQRCLIAGHALWFYLGKLTWPADLAFIYPRWYVNPNDIGQYLFPAAALLVPVILWILRRRLGKGPLVAVLFFGGTLLPALGFFDIYPMRYSFVADHFQYLAGIGPIVLYVAVLAGFVTVPARPRRPEPGSSTPETPAPMTTPAWCYPMATALLILLAGLTWRQGRIYKNDETLWNDTLAKNPGAWIAHNNLGSILEARGQYEQAVSHYVEALRAYPNSSEALNNLGNILAKAKKYDEALKCFTKALLIRPDYADAHYNMGVVLAAQQKYWEAAEQYSAALRINPAHADAHHNLAFVLAAQGKHGAAADHYREAVKINPKHALALCNLGILEADLGNTGEAVRCLSEAVRSNPALPNAHYNLALLLAKQGKFDGAAEHYRESLKFDPENAITHNNLGNVFARLGNLDGAISHLLEAVRINPEFADAHYNLALALTRQEKLDDAIKHYREAIRIQPENAAAHNNLGNLLVKQDKLEDATYHLAEAQRLKPGDATILTSLANIMIQQGKLAEATAYLTEASRVKPDDPAILNNLGNLLEKQGKIEEATARYREALRLVPNWLAVTNHLAWVLATHENPGIRNGTEALAMAKQMCEATEYKNPFALDTLAAAYAEAGQFKEAVETAHKAVTQARESGADEAIGVIERRLKLYAASQPFRDRPQTATRPAATRPASTRPAAGGPQATRPAASRPMPR